MSKPIQERIYKSRLTITYRTNIDGQAVPQKLPLRILVLGDFSGRGWKNPAAAGAPKQKQEAGDRLENRRVISIKRGTRVEDVMADMGITVPIPSYDHRELCGTARGDFAGATLKGPISEGVAQLKGSVELSAAPQHGDGGFKGVLDGGWSLPTMDLKLTGTVGTQAVKEASCRVVLFASSAAIQTFEGLIADVAVKTKAFDAAVKDAAEKLTAKADADTAKGNLAQDATQAQKDAADALVASTTQSSDTATTDKGTAETAKTTAVAAAGTARLAVSAYGYANFEASAGTWKAAGYVTMGLTLKLDSDKRVLDTTRSVTFTGKDQEGKDVPAAGKDKDGNDVPAAGTTITVASTAKLNPFVTSPLTLVGKIGEGVTGRVGPVDSEVTGAAIEETIKVISAKIEPDGATEMTVSGGALAKLAIPITGLDSFSPDNVAENIHEIRRLLLLKSLLAELSSYVSNRTEMRQALFDSLPSTNDATFKAALTSVYPKLLIAFQPNGSS